MPYAIKRNRRPCKRGKGSCLRGNKPYRIVNIITGETVGKTKSKKKALASIRYRLGRPKA